MREITDSAGCPIRWTLIQGLGGGNIEGNINIPAVAADPSGSLRMPPEMHCSERPSPLRKETRRVTSQLPPIQTAPRQGSAVLSKSGLANAGQREALTMSCGLLMNLTSATLLIWLTSASLPPGFPISSLASSPQEIPRLLHSL